MRNGPGRAVGSTGPRARSLARFIVVGSGKMSVSKNQVTRARLRGAVKYLKMEKEEDDTVFPRLGSGAPSRLTHQESRGVSRSVDGREVRLRSQQKASKAEGGRAALCLQGEHFAVGGKGAEKATRPFPHPPLWSLSRFGSNVFALKAAIADAVGASRASCGSVPPRPCGRGSRRLRRAPLRSFSVGRFCTKYFIPCVSFVI